MALLHLSLPSPTSLFVGLHSRPIQLGSLPRRCLCRQFRCTTTTQTAVNVPVRRSADWQPTLWPDEFIQCLDTNHIDETCMKRMAKLKVYVKSLLFHESDPVDKLELVDVLERLGVGYHYKDEIKEVLGSISIENKEDLYSTALLFRLLRQHGYKVSQDFFTSFQDEHSCFKEFLQHDTKGLLSLYEASHIAFEGEDVLDEARTFAHKHLTDLKGDITSNLEEKVRNALELPFHWRTMRFEARWFIELYEKESGMNPSLLEFAKLDFNKVQAIYRKDLKEASRWWKNLGLAEELDFARDRLMENFMWATGVCSDPQFCDCRGMLTKIGCLITTIDDVYDVYGSIDELELFTDAVDRWDVKAIEQLPGYMKLCFLALYNTCNEIGYKILKGKGSDFTFYLSRMWADLCKSFLIEARWYHNKYVPTMEEYLNNAWISVSGALILGHVYCYLGEDATKEGLECLLRYPNSIHLSSLLFRLCNDMGTSTEELTRGDVPKAIQCYMHHENVSESVTREHVKGLISEAWKKLNEYHFSCSIFAKPFVDRTVELARISHTFYLHGDGIDSPDKKTKERAMSLLVEPFY